MTTPLEPEGARDRRAATLADPQTDPEAPLLLVNGLTAGYGAVTVLHDVTLVVRQGEIVSLVGANAAGKTTLLRTISGVVPAKAGAISFAGRSLVGLDPADVVRLGVSQVPEGRHVFPDMTVAENLELGAAFVEAAWAARAETFRSVTTLFPRLAERLKQKAGTLSGGEQQMLAIGRALMARPRLLLVDEPSAGLAPVLAQTVFRALREINRATGLTILLVEQNVTQSLALARRGYVLELGRITLEGSGPALLQNPHVRAAYLGA